jgi:hypothetical protein
MFVANCSDSKWLGRADIRPRDAWPRRRAVSTASPQSISEWCKIALWVSASIDVTRIRIKVTVHLMSQRCFRRYGLSALSSKFVSFQGCSPALSPKLGWDLFFSCPGCSTAGAPRAGAHSFFAWGCFRYFCPGPAVHRRRDAMPGPGHQIVSATRLRTDRSSCNTSCSGIRGEARGHGATIRLPQITPSDQAACARRAASYQCQPCCTGRYCGTPRRRGSTG